MRPLAALWRGLRRLLPWVLFTALLAAAFHTAAGLSDLSNTASLRFYEGLDGSLASAARQAAQDARTETPDSPLTTDATTGEPAIWPSFWAQEKRPIQAGAAEAETELDCLLYSGEAAAVWPANFIKGGYPGPTDLDGCALSKGAAWRLFGSLDVVGQTLRVNGQLHTIRGVFEGEDELVLLSLGARAPSGGWQAMELSGLPTGQPRQAALDFAQSAGLPTPDAVLMPQGFAGAAGVAAWALPVLLGALALIVALWQATTRCPRVRPWVLLGAALLIALLLPRALDALPPSLLPGQWSDFSHWTGLLKRAGDALQELFLLRPGLRDARFKALLCRQLVIVAALLPCALVLCGRLWRGLRRSAGGRHQGAKVLPPDTESLPAAATSEPAGTPSLRNPHESEVYIDGMMG